VSEFIVNSEEALSRTFGELRELFRANRYLKLKATAGKKRSLNQNDLSHVWYEQMAREDRQEDARGHRRYCKLHHGVPILRAEDSDFREAYDAVIRPLAYELKLVAMDHWPVTSLMTKPQLSAYLEAVQADYGKRGVALEFPQDVAA
jgi:hypothetical protein